MTLQEAIVQEARKYLNVVEQPPGTNSNWGGPIIDWLAFVGITSPASYCAAFASSMVHDAAAGLGVEISFRKSAGALHLMELNEHLKVSDPQPGDIVIFDHGHGLGHVAIVTDIDSPATIAGNTSPDGTSRQGTGVFEHSYDPSNPEIAGYLRIA